MDPNPEVEVEDLGDKVEDLKVDDKDTTKTEDKEDKDKEDKEETEVKEEKTTTVTDEKEETDKDGDKKTVTDDKTETVTETETTESAPSYQQPYTPKLSQSESQPPTPPPKPPRPLSPFSQAQAHLKEAFPDTDDNVIKAVLVASGGEVEPAFTALLSMSDPNFKPEPAARPQRPIGGPGSDASMAQKIHSPRSQIEADERLARQLAGQYDRRTANRTGGVPARYRGSTESNRSYSGRYDEQRDSRQEDDPGFFQSEDWQDFSNQVVQGFNETKNKVNSWVKNLSNRIDGVEGDERQYRDYEEYGDDYYESPRRQQQQQQQQRPPAAPRSESTRGLVGALGSGRESQESQRSYQEFYSSKSSRSKTRVGDDGEFRSISLKNNDLDDDDKPLMPPRPPPKDALAGATAAVNKAESNKWEPLKAVEPQPEEDKDPFFIGDSDDEDEKEEAKKEVKEEVKAEDKE